MLKLYESGVYLVNNENVVTDPAALPGLTGKTTTAEEAAKGTMAYGILKAHNTVENMDQLKLKFDSMTSHDITYVGIIQTVAQGLSRNAQTQGLLRAGADEHAGIAVPEQVVNQQHRTDGGVQANLDAHGFQQLLVAFQQALGRRNSGMP